MPGLYSGSSSGSGSDSKDRPGPSRLASNLVLSAFLAASFGVAALAQPFAVDGLQGWYGTLTQPWFAPPAAVFGPVAFVLLVLLSLSAWVAWRSAPSLAREHGIRFWPVQLLNTFAWIGVFFGMHSPRPAVYNMLVLILSVLLTIWPFFKASTLAGWLLTPFLASCLFALYLNIGIAVLNR